MKRADSNMASMAANGASRRDDSALFGKGLASGSHDDLMWRALLACAFCGLLRGAEVAVADGEAHSAVRHLTRRDVRFRREANGSWTLELTIGPTVRVRSGPLGLGHPPVRVRDTPPPRSALPVALG